MIEVTDEAYTKLLERSESHGGIRIALKPGGCAGFEYKFDYLDNLLEPDDYILDFVHFKIAIDKMSLPMIDGATLDWEVKGINEKAPALGEGFQKPKQNSRRKAVSYLRNPFTGLSF